MIKRLFLLLLLALSTVVQAETGFEFGGYIKADIISTKYNNGQVPESSALSDFHIPALIPVGSNESTQNLDFHAKQSRFNLGTQTTLVDSKSLHSFLEMDFIGSDNGNERVSNSYQPRLRHAYFEYGGFLFGQTWSTFMVTTAPENLDFPAAAEGRVIIRQAQLRYTNGNWQFALENPDTTITPYQGGTRIETGTGQSPDMVVRYNRKGDWGHLSISSLLRQLNYEDTDSNIESSKTGYGVSFGGQINAGPSDNVRFVLTRGEGLGRYIGMNFVNSAVLDSDNELHTIRTSSGYIAFQHHWNDRFRSTLDISAFEADNNAVLSGDLVNKSANSVSINLLYSPDPSLTFGIEYMQAKRELENDTDGSFNRIQFSASYSFSYSSR